MTLSDIERITSDWLTPAQVASYMNSDPQTIRTAAHQRPDLLGFPVTIMGSRVKIPKMPFIKYCKGERINRIEYEVGKNLEKGDK